MVCVHTVGAIVEGPTRSQLALYAAAAIAVLIVGGRYLLRPAASAPPASAPPAVRVQSAPQASVVLVHVAGAVRRPGLYRVRAGARIDDAVRMAGGAARRGDLSAVNLAAKVEDGRQVLVPERASRGGAAAAPASPPGAAASPGASPPAAPISLSTATPEQLDTLPGVGPATVAKIIAYRDEHGGFRSVQDLANVPGIGAKRLETLKDLVQP